MLSLLTFVAAALGGCVGGGATDAADSAASRPPLTAQAGVQDGSDHADLRFVGTVVTIGMRKDFDPVYRWVVVARVERIVEGAYDAETFAFVVHSPSLEQLHEGGRYQIEAAKTSATAYRFVVAKALK